MSVKIYIILFFLLSTTLFSKEKRYSVDYNIDIPITVSSFLLMMIPKLVIPETPSYMRDETLNKEKINSFDKLTLNNYSPTAAKASDILIYSFIGATLGMNYIDNNNYLDETLIMVETVSIAGALNNIVKYAVSRPRPYIYSKKASLKEQENRDSHLSFYSGHATTAFATAISFSAIMSDRFDKGWQKGLIWGVPLTIATTVAYLRVHAGKHFLSDVLVGAIIGASIGWSVPYIHKKIGGKLTGMGNSEGIYIGYNVNF